MNIKWVGPRGRTTVAAGFFVPGSSFLHSCPPGVKGAWACAACAWAFALPSPGAWLILAFLAGVASACGLLRYLIRGLVRFGWPIAFASGIIMLVSPPPDAATWTYGPFALSVEKMTGFVGFLGRIAVLFGTAQLFAATTNPEDLFASNSKAGVPPVLAYAAVGTLQLAPLLADRIQAIREAQASRGVAMDGGPIRRVRALGPLIRPVLLSLISDAVDREITLVVRGFELRGDKTSLRDTPPAGWHRPLLAAGVALLFLAVVGGIVL